MNKFLNHHHHHHNNSNNNSNNNNNVKIQQTKNVTLVSNAMAAKVQLLAFGINVLFAQIMIYVKNVHQLVFILNIT
jgi:hypothetical protein